MNILLIKEWFLPSPHKTLTNLSMVEKTKKSSWIMSKKTFYILLGDVLLSQDPAVQVPSTLEGLTFVFGMGTRGSLPPSSPN